MNNWFFDDLFFVFFIFSFIMVIFSFIKKNFTGISLRSREMNDSFERLNLDLKDSQPRKPARTAVNYECPNCGADLSGKSDVSPSGDAKCKYCDRWFNIFENAS